MRSIDKDDDGLINREEFIRYFLNRYRMNNESGRPLFLKRIMSNESRKSLNLDDHGFDLVDRILLGIQQVDATDISEER